jgi:hypothetical protein
MINPSAVPHCEILNGLVPGSLLERIFGDASLVLIADHAKEMGSAVCPFENQTIVCFLHFLCDVPHGQDHLASDVFINSTTIPLKRGSSSFCVWYTGRSIAASC